MALDASLVEEPALRACGPLAGYLHLAALCYLRRVSSVDGFIPMEVLAGLGAWGRSAEIDDEGRVIPCDVQRLADRLVAAHYWKALGREGYVAIGYLDSPMAQVHSRAEALSGVSLKERAAAAMEMAREHRERQAERRGETLPIDHTDLRYRDAANRVRNSDAKLRTPDAPDAKRVRNSGAKIRTPLAENTEHVRSKTPKIRTRLAENDEHVRNSGPKIRTYEVARGGGEGTATNSSLPGLGLNGYEDATETKEDSLVVSGTPAPREERASGSEERATGGPQTPNPPAPFPLEERTDDSINPPDAPVKPPKVPKTPQKGKSKPKAVPAGPPAVPIRAARKAAKAAARIAAGLDRDEHAEIAGASANGLGTTVGEKMLAKAVGNPKVQAFFDHVNLLAPEIYQAGVTMNGRNARSITDNSAPATLIAEAYVAARRLDLPNVPEPKGWGEADDLVRKNLSVWVVADRIDAYVAWRDARLARQQDEQRVAAVLSPLAAHVSRRRVEG